MPTEVAEIDGNTDWGGGMDSSRQPHLLFENQYSRACNIIIPRYDNKPKNRFGIHHQELIGDINDLRAYNNASRIQGEGYYVYRNQVILIRVADGLIIEFKKYAQGCYKIKVLNRRDRNNSRRAKAWVTTIPGGAIVQDGESLPTIVTPSGVRRSKPQDGEIGVGRMGAYIQNRYFYVTENCKFIQASDFDNPLEIKNSINTNIHGFLLPEGETITALGKQKSSLNYVDGGVLAFASANDVYSVDVRGDRQAWEVQNTNVGKVQETVPGIGAVSSYSFESFNSNLWFRTIDFGLMNLIRSEFQFNRDDDYSSQSIEVDYWFSNDSELLLDQCYTRAYRNRLLTTVAPEITEDGSIFWNGLISMNPDPNYANEKLPRRFEGLITGVRPWCISSVKGSGRSELFIDSYDVDGKTRLYKIEDNVDYDLNHKKKKIEIESWLETRAYAHRAIHRPKQATRRYYFMFSLSRDLDITTLTRTEKTNEWTKFDSRTHKIKSCCLNAQVDGSTKFFPKDLKPQNRININLVEEKPKGHGRYFFRQDRFEFKGPFSLGMWFREANILEPVTKGTAKEEFSKSLEFVPKKDYTYSIATSE